MKTKKTMRLSVEFAAAAALMTLLAGCYYMPGTAAGAARVGLDVKGVPPNMTSAALVVTAPDMATISTDVSPAGGSVTVSVPAGIKRTFTLLLNSFSATLEAEATVDLQPGESRQITLTPTVGATQIVIPDLLNGRVVQISDMSGTGWTEVKGGNLPTSINPTGLAMSPYAVDFDSLGRIYIANYTSAIGGLLRIDDMNHASTSGVVVDSTTGTTSVAVDRTHGLVYYGTGGTTLSVKDVTNIAASPVSINLALDNASIIGTTGLAADDQGILYFFGYLLPLYTHQLVKYDPTRPVGSRVVATATYSFDSPWGIMVKGPYVYASDSNVNLGKKAQVVRFDKNLQFVDSFPGPSTDPLGRPETFLAVLNKKITVIDEGSNGVVDRLASFDDMTGTGWTTFGSNGPGQNQFSFYSIC